MQQLGLPMLSGSDVSAEVMRHAARRQFVLRRVAENAPDFRPDFPEWLKVHLPLWEAFEREANQVWAEGHRHYGARTIWEVLRHETRHAEKSGDFKLNNNRAPCLARLYLLLYPDRPAFFELRGREAA